MLYLVMYLVVALVGSIVIMMEVNEEMTLKNVLRYTILFPLCVLTFMYYVIKASLKLYKK